MFLALTFDFFDCGFSLKLRAEFLKLLELNYVYARKNDDIVHNIFR